MAAGPGVSEDAEALFRRLYPKIRGLAMGLAGNRQDADDIVQDTFLAVLRGLPGFRGDSEVDTWVYRIATRVAYRQLARRRPRSDVDPDTLMAPPAVADEAERALRDAMSRLSLSHRCVFALVVLQGLSHQSTADVLDIPVGTVWSRLHEARKRLVAILDGSA